MFNISGVLEIEFNMFWSFVNLILGQLTLNSAVASVNNFIITVAVLIGPQMHDLRSVIKELLNLIHEVQAKCFCGDYKCTYLTLSTILAHDWTASAKM